MTSILNTLATPFTKPRPEVRPGFTVRVHERIQEGGKERIQVFEGLVINVHKGSTAMDTTFTVRRIASGVGVERVFPLHSPKIEKIEVKKVAKIRRAKLFFLRGRKGKAARLSERFTTAEEFAVAAPVVEEDVVEEEVIEEVVEDASKDAGDVKDANDAGDAGDAGEGDADAVGESTAEEKEPPAPVEEEASAQEEEKKEEEEEKKEE